MPLPEVLAILMVAAVIAALMAGYPVALTLAGVSLIFALLLGHVLGAMGLAILGALPQRIYGVMTNDVLLALPMFVFMGVMLERSDIAGDLSWKTWAGCSAACAAVSAFSAVIVGALLAASTGIVGATAVTMGLIMLPAMLRHGYDQRASPPGRSPPRRRWHRSFPPSTVLVGARRPTQYFLSSGAARQGQFRAATGVGEPICLPVP